MTIKNQFEKEISLALSLNNVEEQLNALIKSVEKFQEKRAEPQEITVRKETSLDRFLSVGVLEILDKEESNMQLWVENNTNQVFTVAVLGAAKSILNNENNLSLEETKSYKDQINNLLNKEKKISHKYNQIGTDYTKNAQSLMYDMDKLLGRHEITKPSIEERVKKIQIEQKDKGPIYIMEKNESLSKEQFEDRVKRLLSQEDSKEQIEDVLELINKFEQDNINKAIKKLKNPLDLAEKLLPYSSVSESETKNAIIDWLWQDAKNREAILMALMMIQNKINVLNENDKSQHINNFEKLTQNYETLCDTVKNLVSNKITVEDAIKDLSELKEDNKITSDIVNIRNKMINPVSDNKEVQKTNFKIN